MMRSPGGRRARPLLRRFGPPALALAGTAAVWYGLTYHDSVDPRGDLLDELIAGGIAVTFALAAAAMLVSRERWTIRAVGVLLTSAATATLYAGLSWHTYRHGRPLPESLVDLVRAAFVLGAPALLYGLLAYVRGRVAIRSAAGWLRARRVLAGRRS